MKDGKTITVTIERGTWEETIYSDGWQMGSKTNLVDRTDIVIRDVDGKTFAADTRIRPISSANRHYAEAVKRGCKGMLGNTYLGPEAYELITQAIAEADVLAPKTQKQIAIEKAAADKAAADKAYRESPAGKAAAAAEARHAKLMREMDRADSDL